MVATPFQECTVAGVPLQGCIMNASGVMCTTAVELQKLRDCDDCSAVVTKSCTNFERAGNPEPRYYCSSLENPEKTSSINSMGLPNMGVDFYMEQCTTYGRTKPHIISVCGLTTAETNGIARKVASEADIKICEINFSCPNVGTGQLGYNFDLAEDHARQISEIMGEKKWGIKLPPYFDDAQFIAISEIVQSFRPGFVTCINSIGNGLMVDIDAETTRIQPRNGMGGLGGEIVLPTALANVWALQNLTPSWLDIVGCGGIMTGEDVFKHILCGATAVQIGTILYQTGTDCFTRLKQELNIVMTTKGYTKLKDFRGNLQII
jgi:dihydroorotate dehydrogenase (fumarate)